MSKNMLIMVSILVLMDESFRQLRIVLEIWGQVSILVLMDESFRLYYYTLIINITNVSILVLMDVSFRQKKEKGEKNAN